MLLRRGMIQSEQKIEVNLFKSIINVHDERAMVLYFMSKCDLLSESVILILGEENKLSQVIRVLINIPQNDQIKLFSLEDLIYLA